MKENKPITQKKYWDDIHIERNSFTVTQASVYKSYLDYLILELIKKFFNGGQLLEVGAGSSDWLVRIAKNLNLNTCTGLDYSEIGCEGLRKKSQQATLNIDVICADLFMPPAVMIRSYDFIVSFGVVEHFTNLSEVISAISAFSKPNGILFTLIPNMAGLNGYLTKFWNKQIYNLHIPHDLDSFVNGHKKVGLEILLASYIGSTNFGVLSSCFQEKEGFKFWLYKQLTRISKLVWFIEYHTSQLPATKFFSPYILIVSRLPK